MVPAAGAATQPPPRPQLAQLQQRPVRLLEPDLLRAKLALHHGDLMAQREDLGVLVPITARQQPQQRERFRDTEICQSKEHEAASSRRLPLPIREDDAVEQVKIDYRGCDRP